LDVLLLTALGAAAQQDDEIVSIPPEVNSISRTKVQADLQNATSDTFDVRCVALFEAGEGHIDLRGCLCIETVEPVFEGAAARGVFIFEDSI
jgi:hypothetical protein